MASKETGKSRAGASVKVTENDRGFGFITPDGMNDVFVSVGVIIEGKNVPFDNDPANRPTNSEGLELALSFSNTLAAADNTLVALDEALKTINDNRKYVTAGRVAHKPEVF